MQRVALLAMVTLVGLASVSSTQPAGTPLPPLENVAAENLSLIVNGDMEGDGGWAFSDWPPRPDTGAKLVADSVVYSQDQAHAGTGSIRIDLTTVEEDRHLLAQQSFTAEALAPYDGRRVRMSAWIWLESGPPGSQGSLSYRLWGPPGAAPVGHGSILVPAVQAEWIESSTEFTLRLGETTRGDITIGMRQAADPTNAPVVYVDDIRLEVILEPPLSARLRRGVTLMTPDNVLATEVNLSDDAWQDGLRHVRWNVTSADGLTSYAEGDATLASPSTVVELAVPRLPDRKSVV